MCFWDCFAVILMIFTVKDWRGGCVREIWIHEWMMDRQTDRWMDGWMEGLRWRMGSRMDGGTDAEKLEKLPWGRKGINHGWWQFLTDDILSPPSQNFWVWERRRGGSIRVEGWGISPGDKEGPQRTWISFFSPSFFIAALQRSIMSFSVHQRSEVRALACVKHEWPRYIHHPARRVLFQSHMAPNRLAVSKPHKHTFCKNSVVIGDERRRRRRESWCVWTLLGAYAPPSVANNV